MLEELERLIEFIQKEYIEFNRIWRESEYYSNINLKNKLVCDCLDNEEILNNIFNYRKFLNEKNIALLMQVKMFNTSNAKVNIRTKAKNSIEYKIKNYMGKNKDGKSPIKKCFNDLLGVRIIFSEEPNFEEISSLIKEKYDNIKCIDSSKGEYKAIHIYFEENNYSFPWELQVWNKNDEMNNIISHEKYKQDYVRWEKENKGGNI